MVSARRSVRLTGMVIGLTIAVLVATGALLAISHSRSASEQQRFVVGNYETMSLLRDALIVNPYDVDEMADAIAAAIEMPVEQRMLRMRRMREVVREHNIYRWAGVLLGDMTRIPERQEVRTG